MALITAVSWPFVPTLTKALAAFVMMGTTATVLLVPISISVFLEIITVTSMLLVPITTVASAVHVMLDTVGTESVALILMNAQQVPTTVM